jgi:hypothetical protein
MHAGNHNRMLGDLPRIMELHRRLARRFFTVGAGSACARGAVSDSLIFAIWHRPCSRQGMKKTLLALLLLVGGTSFAQLSIGVRIGPPPPPRIVHARPRAPGPDYFWVDGYWYPVGGRYRWHNGYWTRPPYGGARWIGPRYEGGQFFEGYWEGDRGRFDHDHRWDRDRNRDFGHDRDRDRR